MKKRVFNLLILVFAFATTFNSFSQRKVETTHLIVKSAKNAAVLGTDEKGRVVEKELDLSNLVTEDNIENFIPQIQAGANITINKNNPLMPVINAVESVPENLQQTLDAGNIFNSQIVGSELSEIKLSKNNNYNNLIHTIYKGDEIKSTGLDLFGKTQTSIFKNDGISVSGQDFQGVLVSSKMSNIGTSSSKTLSNGSIQSTSTGANGVNVNSSENVLSHSGSLLLSKVSFKEDFYKRGSVSSIVTDFERGGINVGANGNDIKIVFPYTILDTSPFNTIDERIEFPLKTGVVALTSDIPIYQSGTNVAIDNSDPLNPIINVNGGVNSTDLSYVASPSQGTVESSNGNNAIIPLANNTNAGLMYPGFNEISTETVTATMIAHQDNVLNGSGVFALNDPDIKVNYTKTGRLKRMSFNLGIDYTSLEPTDKGDWIVKVPLSIHGSAGEGANLPLRGHFFSVDTFDSAFKNNDAFSCKGSFNTNTGEIILKIKFNNEVAPAEGISGISYFHFNLVYRTDS